MAKKTINVQLTIDDLKQCILHYYKDDLNNPMHKDVEIKFKQLSNSNPDANIEFDVVSLTVVEEMK